MTIIKDRNDFDTISLQQTGQIRHFRGINMKTDTKTNAKLRKLSTIVSLCIIAAILLGQITLRIIEKKKAEKLHDNAVAAAQEYLQTKIFLQESFLFQLV